MNERNVDTETPARWSPFGRPPVTEPPDAVKLVKEMRKAADDVAEALDGGRPADALEAAGRAVEAAAALHAALGEHARPATAVETLRASLFRKEGTR